jgi:hypothetical protein
MAGGRAAATDCWSVSSVWVRTADGPHRVEQVYRLLLNPIPEVSQDTKQEESHASRYLCESLDRASKS